MALFFVGKLRDRWQRRRRYRDLCLKKACGDGRRGEPPLGWLVVGEDGRTDIVLNGQIATRSSVSPWRAFVSAHSTLRESVSEICNCLLRIWRLYKSGRESHLRMGFLYLRIGSQGLRPNTTRLGRIEDRGKLLSVRPWASLQDQQLFLCGWEAGREWALRHLGENGEETIGYSHSSEELLAELGGHSMPPQSAQQASTRGPSDPPPSPELRGGPETHVQSCTRQSTASQQPSSSPASSSGRSSIV